MKAHIVNILPHEPDYDYMQDKPRPEVNWDTQNGSWVGIYRNEIPDKLGGEVLKYTDEFIYEVWQPDYRADKMYSHQFEDGLIHRLFPACDVKELHGIKFQKRIHSPALIDFLLSYSIKHPVVVNTNGGLNRLNAAILGKCRHLPILQTFRGTLHLPKTMIFKPRLNVLASFSYLNKHWKLKKLMPAVDFVMHMNDLYLDELREVYKGPLTKATSGCDFNFWSKTDKGKSREALGIPQDKTVFFTSSLLIPIKQVDKVIEIFKRLASDYDFMLIISGHGTNTYEKYLYDLAKPLIEKDKIRFVGYVTGEELKGYYNSADLFINSSVSEGGPVSAMKAIACETPVFSTDIGNVAERMRNNGAGKLVDIKDYAQWEAIIKQVLEGEKVELFDRKEAEEYYDWQKIAEKFTKIYQTLYRKYYQPKEEDR